MTPEVMESRRRRGLRSAEATDPGTRARALADLASRLTKIGETSSAIRLAAEVCAVGRWNIAASVVLPLDPDALAMMSQWVRSASKSLCGRRASKSRLNR
jgi:hypothetical protein